MTRFQSTASLKFALIVTTVVALCGFDASATNALAQEDRWTPGYSQVDFGPAPDQYLPNGSDAGRDGRPLPYAPRTEDFGRAYDRGRMNNRSRDPADQYPWNDDRGRYDFRDPELSSPSRSYQPNRPDYGAPRDWESRYTPRPRPYDVQDLPVPPRYDRNPPVSQPTRPSVPAEPTLSEKIAQRYADPKVVRVVQQLNQASGEALYAEISQYIDQRHITPTSYQQRVRSGLENLSTAVQTPSFQQAVRMQANSQAIRTLQQNLNSLAYQVQVQDLNQAIGVMRQAGQMTSQTVGVNPGAVALEFVYGALDTLDKFSMFIAPEKSGETSVGLQENMVGIGVEIEAHPQGLKILKALSGGPAAQATLQRGDIITSVDGKSVAGMALNQAADLIAGRNGTPVQLGLRRDKMIGDVTLIRRPFEVRSVAEVRMETGKIGYIKLDQFTQSSAKEMDDALWSLHNQGMTSLILDLRGNPGGLLTTAIELTDRFLPGGTIVSTRGRTVNDNSQEVARHQNTWKIPLVVLVDQNSASASEIFAAAIQENGRGVIVGEKSYGKGTVQTLFPLRSVPSALRLTTAKFYSPDGREMAGEGVTPDIRVTSMNSDREGYDAALQAALKAAADPRLIDMANQVAKLGRSALRVIKVAI